jgi:deoxyribonuclease-4
MPTLQGVEMLLFGPAGIPNSSPADTAEAGIHRVAELGLGCMELEFVRQARMGEASARAAREAATSKGIKLSAHAPYFVNLNAHEPEKLVASKKRILSTARIAAACGAQDVVFHPAFYLGDPPEEVYAKVRQEVSEILQQLEEEDIDVTLRPEVMGKHSQFGTIEELLNLSSELEGVAPCLDFAHWHARTSAANSYEEFTALLNQVEATLGRQGLDNIHIHVSGISYTQAGERKHLVFEESDFQYRDFLRALRDKDVKGAVICESPSLEEDALLLQRTYREL